MQGTEKTKNFIPVILGSDENAFGNARLCHEAFHIKPIVLCESELIGMKGSSIAEKTIIPDFSEEKVFVPELTRILQELSAKYDKIMMIPCSDYYVKMLSRNADKFDKYLANPVVAYKFLEHFETKDKFYQMCDEYGLSYPRTKVLLISDMCEEATEPPFDFPLIAKPENSNEYEYLHAEFPGKKKVYFLRNVEEYMALAKNIATSSYHGKMILQEFIRGGDENMRVLNTYSDRTGKVRAMCLGQPVLEYYNDGAIGNYAAIISTGDDAIYDKLQKFLEAIHYVGFANFDLKYDKTQQRFVLFEINPRLGRSSFYARAAGLNFMQVLYDDVVAEKPYSHVRTYDRKVWCNMPYATVKKFVTGQKELQFLRQQKPLHTLWYKEDLSPRRIYYLSRYYLAQSHAMNRFFFNKEKFGESDS